MKRNSGSDNTALYLSAIMMIATAAPAVASQTDHVNWKQLCDEVVPAEARAQEHRDVWVFADDHAMAPAARPASITPTDPHLQPMAFTEQTLIPLPSPEWTGLAGLAGLALLRARKAFRRILT